MGFFFVAGVSDYFDGYYARKYGSVTTLGKFLDPIADKLLVSAGLLSLLSLGKVSLFVVLPVVLRDILIDGIRAVAAAEQHIIAAGALGKWKTAIQLFAMPFLFFPFPNQNLFPFAKEVATAALYVAVALSLISGYQYLFAYGRGQAR